MGAPLEVTRRDYTAAELHCLSSRRPDGDQVRRILAIAMVLEGWDRTEAAEFNGMDRQTLRDWVHRYNAVGVEGLKSRRSPGRPPTLTPLQRAELLDLVIAGPTGGQTASPSPPRAYRRRPAGRRTDRSPPSGDDAQPKGQSAAGRSCHVR